MISKHTAENLFVVVAVVLLVLNATFKVATQTVVTHVQNRESQNRTYSGALRCYNMLRRTGRQPFGTWRERRWSLRWIAGHGTLSTRARNGQPYSQMAESSTSDHRTNHTQFP